MKNSGKPVSMKNARNGLFVVFEGIDGTGKSTQMRLLGEALKNRHYAVVETREPTTGKFGQQIRSLYLKRSTVSAEEELELFVKDRRQHLNNLILPSLKEGKIVLCDRYFLSTAAYQGAAGCDPGRIISLHEFAPDPDLAIIIEVDPEVSIRRITEKRGDALNDFEQLESLKKVDSIFRKMDLPYIERIDGSLSVMEVHHQVLALVEKLLPHSETGQQEP